NRCVDGGALPGNANRARRDTCSWWSDQRPVVCHPPRDVSRNSASGPADTTSGPSVLCWAGGGLADAPLGGDAAHRATLQKWSDQRSIVCHPRSRGVKGSISNGLYQMDDGFRQQIATFE